MTTDVAGIGKTYDQSSITRWTLSLLFFVASFLFLLITMDRNVNVYDEALILEGTIRVLAGAIPHRDFYTNYGPGQFYVLGALFKALGTSVLVERLWDTLVRTGIATAALILVLRLSTPWQSIVAGILSLVWLARAQNYAFPLFPSLLFALIGCIFTLYFFERRTVLCLILAGASAGAATLFRYDVGFYTVVAITVVLLVFSISCRNNATQIVRTVPVLALGVLIVCLPIAVTYILNGTAADFYLDIIDYPVHSYAKMRSLPFPDLRSVLGSKDLAAVYFPPVIWASVIVAALLARERADLQMRKQRWVMLLLTLLSALFYIKGLVRVSVVHMMGSIVPALMLAALLPPQALSKARATTVKVVNGLAYALLVATALLTLQALPNSLSNAGANLQWVVSGGIWKAAEATYAVDSCWPRKEFARLACFKIETDRGQAIDYILHNSLPSDSIFEGVPHHDKLLLNDMLIYFATDRRPASKWYHFDPGLQTSQFVQDKMVAELEAARPRFIVIDSAWDTIAEPNASSISSGVEVLDRFIAQHYAPVRQFGSITLMSPNAGASAKPSSTNGQ